ncbi:YceD family protein [uncultured Abyssibacter sp.]|uniref:YceD family protein n=1 Tax=uncultured Abyssibacter sp. TaxID=2320202 RepID=UPI0032B2E97B
MQRPMPVWIDLARAPARQQMEGLITAERMPRLLDAGVELLRPAEVSLHLVVPEFRSDARPAEVTGRIVALVSLQCQRCMEAMDHAIDAPVHWHLVASDSVDVDADADPIVLDGDRFQVLDAVTDELLLAVPSYPRHAECAPPDTQTGSDDN